MADISVLQIGADDWTADIDTTGIDWQYTTILDLPTRLALQKDPYILEQTYVVLTDATLSSTLLSGQISAWPALRTIYFAKKMTPEFQEVLDERRAFCIPNRTPEAVQKRIQEDFNFDQIGFSTRFSEQQFIPMPHTGIHFKREGRFSAQFSGDFGTTWQQIGTLNTFVGDLMPRVENMIWLDYEQTDTVSVQLQFVFYKDNHMQTVQTITGDELRQQHPIGGIEDYQDYQILIFAKGTGQLDLHVLHQRRSRHLLGTLLPGDEWQMTDEHEEVLSYFNPGDRQAPLIVNFSGIRLHVDGFEMRGPFNELGTPYLLFSDVRMQGGAFHIGSEMYEQKVVEIIKKAMKTLHLEPKDVILTGYSMGSFPAMYYAADIKPHAIVVAKPLISLGTLTGKSEFPREVNQDWTLDVRRFLAGRMHPDDTDMLDNILWQHIENVDWSKIAVALFTLKQDEYDGQSLPRLLAFFEENKTHLIHIQEEGTHTAKIPEMITFMKTHLAKLKDSMRREDR